MKKNGVAKIVVKTSKLRKGKNRLNVKASGTTAVTASKAVYLVVRVK